ncbi:nuclear distribution protein nudE-like 1 [Styela clava]|uniref:nuclear distribution protein nudE-like 1 n=1 Tax=Styela clava TaxID=7725 RepID=UPI001939E390|nr:nuclear distribution protein nudE-like 1 [Styela clava]
MKVNNGIMSDCEEFKTNFTDPEQELQYWKNQAHQYKKIVGEVQDEMAEFTESSKELEKELEAMNEMNEKELKDMRQKNMKLNLECESLKEKLEMHQAESHRQITDLESALAMETALKAENIKYIRELEQANDDLERTKRATIVSLEDFEQRLNHALERNAFLESELDEKEALAVTVQRLRDEARDLSQELAVRQRKDVPTEHNDTKLIQSTPSKPSALPALARQPSGSSPAIARTNTISQPSTPTREQNGILPQSSTPKPAPLTPSARVSALNIVGELLRKVGALETKLSSCRNFVRESPSSQKVSKSNVSQLESPGWERQATRSNGTAGISNSKNAITTSMKISV